MATLVLWRVVENKCPFVGPFLQHGGWLFLFKISRIPAMLARRLVPFRIAPECTPEGHPNNNIERRRALHRRPGCRGEPYCGEAMKVTTAEPTRKRALRPN